MTNVKPKSVKKQSVVYLQLTWPCKPKGPSLVELQTLISCEVAITTLRQQKQGGVRERRVYLLPRAISQFDPRRMRPLPLHLLNYFWIDVAPFSRSHWSFRNSILHARWWLMQHKPSLLEPSASKWSGDSKIEFFFDGWMDWFSMWVRMSLFREAPVNRIWDALYWVAASGCDCVFRYVYWEYYEWCGDSWKAYWKSFSWRLVYGLR